MIIFACDLLLLFESLAYRERRLMLDLNVLCLCVEKWKLVQHPPLMEGKKTWLVELV